jgi:hypothetical protein
MQHVIAQEMYYEASGAFEEAEMLLREQLAEAPEAPALLKRSVALEKSRTNIGGAIEALRRYLDVYQTDREAWEELGELYLQVWGFSLPGSVLHAQQLLVWGLEICVHVPGPASYHAERFGTVFLHDAWHSGVCMSCSMHG